VVDDQTYTSPSTAGHVIRDGKKTDGWKFWHVLSADGTSRETLHAVRQRYIDQRGRGNPVGG
jgi:hypothetical protein